MPADRPAHVVGVLVFPRVDELDVVGAFEIVAKAAECTQHRGLLAAPLLLGATRRVSGANGLSFDQIGSLNEAGRCAALVVPGGAGVAAAARDGELVRTVRDAHDRGIPLYSVCSGAFVLAAAGVLAGRRVSVHRRKTTQLAAAAGPSVSVTSSGLLTDGTITSVGGADAGVKSVAIGFALLARFAPECAGCVSDRMEVRPL